MLVGLSQSVSGLLTCCKGVNLTSGPSKVGSTRAHDSQQEALMCKQKVMRGEAECDGRVDISSGFCSCSQTSTEVNEPTCCCGPCGLMPTRGHRCTLGPSFPAPMGRPSSHSQARRLQKKQVFFLPQRFSAT